MRNIEWYTGDFKRVDIHEKIASFKEANPNGRICIGTDSKYYPKYGGFKVDYITVIVLDPGTRKGSQLLIARRIVRNMRRNERLTMFDRLWKECVITKEIATWMREDLGAEAEVHLDLNPNEDHKSNRLYAAAIGFFVEANFAVKAKPDGPAASSAADHYIREGVSFHQHEDAIYAN